MGQTEVGERMTVKIIRMSPEQLWVGKRTDRGIQQDTGEVLSLLSVRGNESTGQTGPHSGMEGLLKGVAKLEPRGEHAVGLDHQELSSLKGTLEFNPAGLVGAELGLVLQMNTGKLYRGPMLNASHALAHYLIVLEAYKCVCAHTRESFVKTQQLPF